MNEISVEELAQWRASGRHFILLDVREPYELAAASLPDALHIPMREIPARLGELEPDADIAVLCHHGGRSEHVARFLNARGFERAHNVDGGIDAYSLRIDPSVPRY
jgi:rhodanese-related sulfurtransferase